MMDMEMRLIQLLNSIKPFERIVIRCHEGGADEEELYRGIRVEVSLTFATEEAPEYVVMNIGTGLDGKYPCLLIDVERVEE